MTKHQWHIHLCHVLTQRSATFLGSRARWAPDDLAVGQTGKNNLPDTIKVQQTFITWTHAQLRHSILYFSILFRTVLRSTPPIFSFILFFQTTKNVPLQGASQHQHVSTISVYLLNPARCENNRSSFGAFTGAQGLDLVTNRREPDLARGRSSADPSFTIYSKSLNGTNTCRFCYKIMHFHYSLIYNTLLDRYFNTVVCEFICKMVCNKKIPCISHYA